MTADQFNLTRPRLVFIFFTFVFAYLLVSYLTNTYLLTNDFYALVWSKRFSANRVQEMLSSSNEIKWISYIITPVLLIGKIFLITVAIQAGLFFSNINLSFKKVLQVVLLAELIPFLSTLVQFIYFKFTGISSFEQITSFAPLSVYSLLRHTDIPFYISYPLQLINLFQVAYWILLAVGLKIYLGKSFFKNLKLIASSYGVALLLWILIVVFTQLQSGE